jgi:hypothetical protein
MRKLRGASPAPAKTEYNRRRLTARTYKESKKLKVKRQK